MIRTILTTLLLITALSQPAHPATAQTATPPPIATTIAKMTPEQKVAMRAYATVVLVKVIEVMIEETAVAVRDDQMDGMGALGAIIVIGALISETRGVLAGPAPYPEFKTAWAELGKANQELRQLLAQWMDQKLNAAQLLKALPTTSKRIDTSNAALQQVLTKRFKIKPQDVQRSYDDTMAELRKNLKQMLTK